MTEDCIIQELPDDEVERIMVLHEQAMKEGPPGVAGKLMKELSIPMLKIIHEELRKNEIDCVLGMLSFFSTITGNIIANTDLVNDIDASCELMGKTFCLFVDHIKPPLHELKKSRP